MKRWHAELQLMQARHEAHTAFYGAKRPSGGYFRKNRPFDCGHSRCYQCHGLKLQHEKTDAQISADEDLLEQVQEIIAEGYVSQKSALVLEAFVASI